MKITSQSILLLITLLLTFNKTYAQPDKVSEHEGDTTVLTFAEQMPEFPGGIEEMLKYLSTHINYPKAAQKKGIEGKTLLTFVVCENGQICKIESVGKKLGYGMEEEAIRVVGTMPAWKPGTQNGKPVFVRFTLPIRYQLTDSPKTDTLYYNRDWKICKKDSASFLRTITPGLNFAVSDYYYPSMQLQMTGTYKEIDKVHEIENGAFKYYSDSGYKTSEGVFIDGKKEGLWVYFSHTGSVWYSKNFVHDKEDGNSFTYYPNGDKRRLEEYRNGILKKGYCYTPEGKDTTYFPMIEVPSFDGGEEALFKFLSKTIQYPAVARENDIQGKVIVAFTVEANGKLEEVEIVSSPHYSLSTEALRVIFLMPRWKPARMEGIAVPYKFTLPVRFQLN